MCFLPLHDPDQALAIYRHVVGHGSIPDQTTVGVSNQKTRSAYDEALDESLEKAGVPDLVAGSEHLPVRS